MAGEGVRTIVHFTRDLRLDDHAALSAAHGGAVVPVVVIDPIATERLRSSPRRAAAYCSAVAALATLLERRGSRLIVRRGRVGPTLRALARAVGSDRVVWSAAFDAKGVRHDRDVQNTLEEAGIRATIVPDAPAWAPEETAGGRSGYRAFVPYFERWRKAAAPPLEAQPVFAGGELPSEPLPDPAEFGSRLPLDPAFTPELARARFERFAEAELLNYAVSRNVPTAGHTSELSAELSFGLISARTLAARVRERGADPLLLAEEQVSLDLYLRALAQRDFFLQLAYFHEAADESALQEKMRGFEFARNHPALDAWRSGRTGFPLVDAGVRELHATGRMHPRIRAVVASFLCFDLAVDWRVGRDDWEHWLIEDDPALASGNWQWVAGVGADLAAYPRIYNPRKQARRFDPAGAYIRRWVPELAGQPDRAIFEPESDARPQLALALFGDRSYPPPVLDHEAAARAFLERYAREVATRAGASRPSR